MQTDLIKLNLWIVRIDYLQHIQQQINCNQR